VRCPTWTLIPLVDNHRHKMSALFAPAEKDINTGASVTPWCRRGMEEEACPPGLSSQDAEVLELQEQVWDERL